MRVRVPSKTFFASFYHTIHAHQPRPARATCCSSLTTPLHQRLPACLPACFSRNPNDPRRSKTTYALYACTHGSLTASFHFGTTRASSYKTASTREQDPRDCCVSTGALSLHYLRLSVRLMRSWVLCLVVCPCVYRARGTDAVALFDDPQVFWCRWRTAVVMWRCLCWVQDCDCDVYAASGGPIPTRDRSRQTVTNPTPSTLNTNTTNMNIAQQMRASFQNTNTPQQVVRETALTLVSNVSPNDGLVHRMWS